MRKSRKLPIYKYLDISTAHITKKTDMFLNRQAKFDYYSPLIVYKKECGYFINVPDDLDEMEMHLPNDLVECLGFAKKHDCYWLVLDGGAEIIDELKTYEW